MTRRLLAASSVLLLLAGACGDDDTLDALVADVDQESTPNEAAEAETDPDAGAETDDPAAGTGEPTEDDAVADPSTDVEPDESVQPEGIAGLSADEQALVDLLRGTGEIADDEAHCLVDGLTDEGIEAGDLTGRPIDLDEDADVRLSDLILSCVEEPETMSGFVERFTDAYSSSTGLNLNVKEAGCLVATLQENDASFADLRLATPLPFLTDALEACLVLEEGLFEPGFTHGDSEVLDPLWDDCDAGVMIACDELYSISEIGSDYEAFGATCGRRQPNATGGTCDSPFDYGDNAELDAYWDACEAGDGAACDQLYLESPIGSVYEEFGDTCGYRYEDSPVVCENVLG